MADIGNLSLNIKANITDVSTKLGKLEANLKQLNATSFSLVNVAGNISILSNSVTQLANAMGLMKSNHITAASFGSLAKGLNKLDPARVEQSSTAVQKLSKNMNNFGNTSQKLPILSARGQKLFDNLRIGSEKTTLSLKSMAQVLSRIYIIIMSFRTAARALGSAVEYASDLVETQNVVRNAFGVQGEQTFMNSDLMQNSINQFGMSKLTASQWASRYQAMGTALGISQGDMTQNSINMTKLAGDIASFYNVEVAEAAEDLQAIFTGQTRPLTLAA